MQFNPLKWISDSWIQWLNHERPSDGVPLCDFERIRYELRPCDVLLIEGRSRISDIIRTITQSSWSHAALYVGRIHDIEDLKMRDLILKHYNGAADTQLIVEGIMGKGAIVNDIAVYNKDHIRVCRPRGISRQDAQSVMAHAIQKLGYDYDVRRVVDLARFLLPWKLFPRRLGSKLFLENGGDTTKIVCSTMIAEAFASVDFPILPLVKTHDTTGIELIARNPNLYSPRDFDYSPYFDIMKYPFVGFVDYALYRKLPWNRDGLMSHDRVGVRGAKQVVDNMSTSDKPNRKSQVPDLSAKKSTPDKTRDNEKPDPITQDTYLQNPTLEAEDFNEYFPNEASAIAKKKPVETPPTP